MGFEFWRKANLGRVSFDEGGVKRI
jgi:hypothetical protein